MPNGNTASQTAPPDGIGGGAPDTRGDLQPANRAASAFNSFTSLINEIVGNLQDPSPLGEGMPTPSPFSYDSLNQQIYKNYAGHTKLTTA